ncbi:hypothetical protein [Saccharopolyspora sp. 5N708]|uniref:hypothetical protein n=1 Tax=Saccharopolyspora sp. 5N708 TaxID=3457424 RepID=UPI003FD03C24
MLTQTVGWHWIFIVNVPIGIGAVLLAVRVLAPEAGVRRIGLAILSSLATAHTNVLLTTGEPPVSAITSGYRLAFVIGATFAAIALLLAATALRTRPASSGEQGNLPATTPPPGASKGTFLSSGGASIRRDRP